jgi:hypothetical protein
LIAAEIEPLAEAGLLEQSASEIAIHAIENRAKLKDERADEEASACEKPGRDKAEEDGNERDLIRRNSCADQEFRK